MQSIVYQGGRWIGRSKELTDSIKFNQILVKAT